MLFIAHKTFKTKRYRYSKQNVHKVNQSINGIQGI